MSYWKLIRPEATTNLFSDPSFALADPDTEWDIAGDGGGGQDYARSTTYAYYGFSSAVSTLGASAYATLYQSITTTATSYTLSAMVRRSAGGVLTNSQCVAWFDDGAQNWASITAVGGGWYYCVYTGTATAAANQFGVRALEATLYVDGIQLENKAYATTYCDGSRDGCYWNGAPNADTSSRSAESRAGGRVMDFEDDYSFEIIDWMGWGVPPHLVNLDRYAILPGASVNSIKTDVNTLTLTGYFQGSSLSNLHSLRQALVEELAHDRYPQTAEGWQPVLIRYTGASVLKECAVYYDSGLEGSSLLRQAFNERVPVRFVMADPFWHEIGDSVQILDTNDTATLYYLAGRLRQTGQWDNLGLSNVPGAGGTIRAMAYNPHDNRLYVGGNFTNFNQTGTGIDYAVAYDIATDTWERLGAANDVNGVVWAIAVAPNGDVYFGGDFTNLDAGDGNGDYLAYWDLSAGDWASVASGGTEGVMALAFDQSGNLYFGGDFTNWNANADADYIAVWDGSAYDDLDSDVLNGAVRAIAVHPDGDIYIGGSFTTFGATGCNYWCRYDGTNFQVIDTSLDEAVYSLAIREDGTVYLGGLFTITEGDYLLEWNGLAYNELGSGINEGAYALTIAPDGMLYVGGKFTVAGGIALTDEIARWNGSAWAHIDIDLPGVDQTVLTFVVCRQDPTIASNYDLYIGSTATGSAYFSGTATATNDGTAVQYPIIIIERSGGTTAALQNIRNETTGKELLFDYGLLDGETLTIDCRPGQKSITSSMFGSRPDAILANCDFGSFSLQPDTNQITAFVAVSGAPTITAYLLWKDIYRGMD